VRLWWVGVNVTRHYLWKICNGVDEAHMQNKTEIYDSVWKITGKSAPESALLKTEMERC